MSTTRKRKNVKSDRRVESCSEQKVILEKENHQLLENSKYSLDLIISQISFADSKISTSCGFITVVSAVMVFVTENFLSKVDTSSGPVPFWKVLFIITFLVAVFFFLLSIIFHFYALSPNFGFWKNTAAKGKKNHFYYEDIKSYKEVGEYICSVKKMSGSEFEEELLQQVYNNSIICSKKMHFFKIGLWTAFASIICFFACVVCYIQMYS